MVEAVSIVVRGGVVHPGAHGVNADRLCVKTSAISKHKSIDPLKGTGMNEDGAGRTARSVVMDRSSRVAGWRRKCVVSGGKMGRRRRPQWLSWEAGNLVGK
jgi:hypothetical protein